MVPEFSWVRRGFGRTLRLLSKDRPHWPLVTGDEQLAGVAELEGFDVIVPEAAR